MPEDSSSSVTTNYDVAFAQSPSATSLLRTSCHASVSSLGGDDDRIRQFLAELADETGDSQAQVSFEIGNQQDFDNTPSIKARNFQEEKEESEEQELFDLEMSPIDGEVKPVTVNSPPDEQHNEDDDDEEEDGEEEEERSLSTSSSVPSHDSSEDSSLVKSSESESDKSDEEKVIEEIPETGMELAKSPFDSFSPKNDDEKLLVEELSEISMELVKSIVDNSTASFNPENGDEKQMVDELSKLKEEADRNKAFLMELKKGNEDEQPEADRPIKVDIDHLESSPVAKTEEEQKLIEELFGLTDSLDNNLVSDDVESKIEVKEQQYDLEDESSVVEQSGVEEKESEKEEEEETEEETEKTNMDNSTEKIGERLFFFTLFLVTIVD